MKLLVAGDWQSKLHEEAVFQAFKTLGHDVSAFKWSQYFRPVVGMAGWVDLLFKRVQNKYIFGPRIRRLNDDLIATVKLLLPDAIFIYRGTHILPETLRRIRSVVPKVILIGYNNDDPFARNQHPELFRHFLAGVPLYDLILAYRFHNIEEFLRIGAPRVELLRSWFVPELNHPVKLDSREIEKYECDVVFVGHYEDDGRVACLERIVRRGWRLRLFGPGYDWDPVLRHSPELSSLTPIHLVWGEDYSKALSGGKIALCFFSKLNRDTYTRRCFEIPATRTMMLSEYSDDLGTLFREGEEAEFFRSQDEMIRKLDYYLQDTAHREAIALAGFQRVHADGHDVLSRMRRILALIDEIREKKRMNDK